MSETKHKAVFTADNSDLNKKTDQVATKMQSLGSKIKTLAAGIIAAFSIRAVVNFAKECSKLAAEAEGVKNAFAKIGSTDLLHNLKKVTRGVIEESDLMALAIKAKNFNIPLQDLSKYLEFATNRAIQTGKSVSELTNLIVMGLGRKSSRSMIQLGLSTKNVQEAFKGTGGFMALVTKELEKMGPVADTASIRLGRTAAAVKNLKESWGEYINQNKLFTTILEGTAETLTRLSDPELNFWEKLMWSGKKYEAWQAKGKPGKNTPGMSADALLDLMQLAGKDKPLDKPIIVAIKTLEDLDTELKQAQDDLASFYETDTAGIQKQLKLIDDLKKKIEALTTVKTKAKLPGRVETSQFEGSIVEMSKNKGEEMADFFGLDLNKLAEAPAQVTAVTDELTLAQQAAKAFGEEMMAAGIQGELSMKNFAQVAAQIAKKIIATYLAEAVAAQIKIWAGTGPWGLALAAGAAAATVALFNSLVPNFADSGAAYGPTLAMVGEAPGISRSNPEYIGTAAQLGKMGMGNKLTARVSRGDLLFVLNEGKASNVDNY